MKASEEKGETINTEGTEKTGEHREPRLHNCNSFYA
jgi:hypothetical protein